MHSLQQNLQDKHIKALIFDLDGVVTQTARVHAQAWKRMFDAYLQKRGEAEGKHYEPLDIETDYREHIDGIPRYDGVRNFLESRGIRLPEGTPEDEAGHETVAGLGNLKNMYFQELVKQEGVDVYEDTIAWLKQQKQKGLRTAIISASKNCVDVLHSAGIAHLFEEHVDGLQSGQLGLKGKPAPDIFLEAARRLGIAPQEIAIFEDARKGVQAGKAGGFGLVVGIDRTHDEAALKAGGADLVIQQFPAP
ncbi:HAD family hydrolase [Pontibacter indicus]|uniref:Beta-phosphoglucomutase n=1 Tax=Pontibacter indicus TaxID=1317125 RepID=A0A1R3WVA5_9BACT|nr:beta-phosphoglucomutase family hydrolase [Pontibacter indicus]SIT81563.1 haloacid dehalogenase superfamily, subfamily IA, variant 3 with third motif having DD or ED/beta-phosphoglucomutase family hydrolase [Pontibacter indicus]